MFRMVAFFLIFFPAALHAEVYKDIMPLDTLGDIKTKFPNSKIEKLTPAWAQPSDAMFQFTGAGLSGTIIILFHDGRPYMRTRLDNGADDIISKERYLKLIEQSDNDALSVNWVRWSPDKLIPLQRLISKYGKPDRSGFDDDNYQPYREWKQKGVLAKLTDDEKNVLQIDYSFTRGELRRAYLAKFNLIPEWLKDDTASIKKK